METPKKFLIFQERETLKKFLIFREMELASPSSKNKKNSPPKKIHYISGNGTF